VEAFLLPGKARKELIVLLNAAPDKYVDLEKLLTAKQKGTIN
jgi:hypothetical protein